MKAVLFDLDGTLLRVDTQAMIDAYVRALARWFADRIPPGRFLRALHTATQAMMRNEDPARTNRDVFAAAFYPAIGASEAAMAGPLAEFYARAYPTLRGSVRPDPAARQAVRAALDRGLQAVIATQPIFPETAIRQRLAWAGIGDLPFTHITTYETAHFCKPHPGYFLEIAETIGRKPGECLMAGNDADHDIAASRVGMRTFLVTDHVIGRAGALPAIDHTGTLADLAAFLAGDDR